MINQTSRFFIIASSFKLPRVSLWALRSYDFYKVYYSFCAGNAPEARRDLNIATEILLANVTGKSTFC